MFLLCDSIKTHQGSHWPDNPGAEYLVENMHDVESLGANGSLEVRQASLTGQCWEDTSGCMYATVPVACV